MESYLQITIDCCLTTPVAQRSVLVSGLGKIHDVLIKKQIIKCVFFK